MRKLPLSLVQEKFPVVVPEWLSLTIIFMRSFGQCFFFLHNVHVIKLLESIKIQFGQSGLCVEFNKKEQEEPVFPKNKAL